MALDWTRTGRDLAVLARFVHRKPATLQGWIYQALDVERRLKDYGK